MMVNAMVEVETPTKASKKHIKVESYKRDVFSFASISFAEACLSCLIEKYGLPCAVPASEGIAHICRSLALERRLVLKILHELDQLHLIEFVNVGRKPELRIHIQAKVGLLKDGKVVE